MKKKPSLFARLARRARYEFDQTMSAGPIALIGWLAILSIAGIAIAAAFLVASGIGPSDSQPLDYAEAYWEATMRTVDPGGVGGDQGWRFRGVMLVVTLFGILIVSSLIGLLSAGVQSRLDELRKGRSFVPERNHTIILNWSAAIFDVISELMVAHARDGRYCIVILADKDKVEMEDEIAAKVRVRRHVRIVCRSGDPADLHDLDIVNLNGARAIIVVSPEVDNPDTHVIKTVLALVHGPERRVEPYRIAVEIRDEHNAAVLRAVGGGEVQSIMADDLISRIIVNSSRQRGLSAVYSELLEFEGCEIYTLALAAIVGKTYGEALFAFETGALIGLCDEAGKISLNPPADSTIEAGMRAVLVAEDRDAVSLAKPKHVLIETEAVRPSAPHGKTPHRTLIIGWNRRGALIAHEISQHMAPGSLLTVAADTPGFADAMAALAFAQDGVEFRYQRIDARSQTAIDTLQVSSYDHIIVLSHSDSMPVQAADTLTLVTLLHLLHIAERDGKSGTIVSEMADVRNRELAEATRADDFVVSDRLVSLMLTQAAESEHASAIFAELLDDEGAEIYMRPAGSLIETDRPVSFYTVIEAARRRGETAFGYRRHGGTVALNPKKSEKVTFLQGDQIVVLAHS
jgi:voltage-gated potassium channel Kch